MRIRFARVVVATAAFAVCTVLHAASLSSDDLFSPEWRGKTVTVEGVVHSAEPLPGGGMALAVYRTVSAFTVVVSDAGLEYARFSVFFSCYTRRIISVI